MPIIVHAEPPEPLGADQDGLLAEVVASVRARPEIAELRIEGHGCIGEDEQDALARSDQVRDRLAELGLSERLMTTVGYTTTRRRGCSCSCDMYEVASPDSKKNCPDPTTDCLENRSRVFRVEFSVRVCTANGSRASED